MGVCVFCRKWKMGMFFVKKMENGGCFVKKVENGFFCKKSGPFLNVGCIMYSISIFLHFTYLGAYAPPCLRAWGGKLKKPISPGLSG